MAVLGVIAVAPPLSAQALKPADSTVTAGQLVNRLRTATDEIVERACSGLRDRAMAAVTDAVALADQLDSTFEEDLDTPLGELGERLRDSAGQGVAALIQAEAFVQTMRACVGEDIELMLDAFRQNVARSARDRDSWSGGRARILRAVGDDDNALTALKAGTAQSIAVEGWNLDGHDCGTVEATLTRAGQAPVAASAAPAGDNLISVHVPPLEEPGLYELSVRVPRRRFLVFCGSTRASFTIPVHSATPFRVHYTISTTSSAVRTVTWNAGELKRANESCGADALAETVFRLPDGWTYESHEWIVFVNSGAVKTAEAVRDNEVRIEYRVPGKAGPFCTGTARMIHGKMVMHGTRTDTVPGPGIDRQVRRPLGFGERRAVPILVEAPEGATIADWTIDVRFLYPDGSERRVPVQSGAGRLTGSEPGGAGFSWDPETRQLIFTTPAQICRPESVSAAAGRVPGKRPTP